MKGKLNMKNKYEHLLNLNEQRVVLMSGIPGAGKSTIADDFREAGYIIVCPDTYRGVISKTIPGREHWSDAMHEGNQSVSREAWDLAQKEAIEFLKEGKSIVFDALLHTPKARRKLFAKLDRVKVPYYSVYVDTTFKTALERNAKRGENNGRSVPEFVIHDKWRTQSLPSITEGFKEAIVVSELSIRRDITEEDRNDFIERLIKDPRETVTYMMEKDMLCYWFPSLYQCWGKSQDNHHHALLLHEHMIRAAELIEDRSFEMVITALLHDVGKRDTKEFFVKVVKENDYFKVGEKLVVLKSHPLGVTVEKRTHNGVSNSFLSYDVIEIDKNAHFYNHEQVGALDARRDLLNLGFDEDLANRVYVNILHHMDLPYKQASNKHLKKMIQKVGNEGIRKLLHLRKADKRAGSEKSEFLTIHKEMVKQVEDIIKGD